MYSVRYTTNVLPIYVNILNIENNTNRSRGGGHLITIHMTTIIVSWHRRHTNGLLAVTQSSLNI